MIRTLASALLLSAAALTAPAAAVAQQSADAPAVEIQEMVLGQADAPVSVIEYASFTCPHCANFHENVFDEIKANYVDTGKVKFTYREVYFDRPGLWASMVARCGGEAKFFGIADMIYDTQKEWLSADDGAGIIANLRRIGRTAGISEEQLDTCLSDGATAQALVSWNETNLAADKITGTPSFIIDGELHSNMSAAEFSKLLDAKLAEEG